MYDDTASNENKTNDEVSDEYMDVIFEEEHFLKCNPMIPPFCTKSQ